MSEVLQFDGKEYVPASKAGKHFNYTKDYMLMLAKAGKIDGRKVGHKWFVNIPSIEKYFKFAKEKSASRREELSRERKEEIRSHAKKTSQVPRSGDFSFEQMLSKHARVAMLETAVIVVLGVAIGTFGYVGTTGMGASISHSEHSFFEKMALNVHGLFSLDTPAAQNSQTASVQITDEFSGRIGTTTHTSFVIAPDEIFTATTIESLQESFSDEVDISVDINNPRTGIVVPRFTSGEGEAYRFLMVPVGSNNSTQ